MIVDYIKGPILHCTDAVVLTFYQATHDVLHLIQAFFWVILWRLIEALASEGLSFLPIP